MLLGDRCPANVPPKQWESALGYTWCAKCNCLEVPDYLIDRQEGEKQFARFAEELERRSEGQVGPETIMWIWDEIERLSTCGKWCAQAFRPTCNGRLKEPSTEWHLNFLNALARRDLCRGGDVFAGVDSVWDDVLSDVARNGLGDRQRYE
jgi:hypothetical protein